jgi:UDP-N-acetylglucosamine acyltransferase
MIHPTTIIEKGAVIAKDVEIGPFCYIGANAVIDSGCILESNVVMKGSVRLEKNVKIFSFAAIGNEKSQITIGENTVIREFVQIDTFDETGRGVTIGADNFIMAYVQVFDGVCMGSRCVVTNAVRIQADVQCDDFVIIGGLSSIEAGNKIGSGAMIGGASYVDHDVPPFCLVEGNRSSIKGLNLIGLRRRIDDLQTIEEIKSAYRKLLGFNVEKTLAQNMSEDAQNNDYVRSFAGFIAASNLR